MVQSVKNEGSIQWRNGLRPGLGILSFIGSGYLFARASRVWPRVGVVVLEGSLLALISKLPSGGLSSKRSQEEERALALLSSKAGWAYLSREVSDFLRENGRSVSKEEILGRVDELWVDYEDECLGLDQHCSERESIFNAMRSALEEVVASLESKQLWLDALDAKMAGG